MPNARPRILAFSFFVLLASSSAQAQVTTINDTTSTPIPGAGHDYIHLLSETVNPANGSVSLRIQLPMPKGRGISIPFAFAYDSNGLNHLIPNTSPGTAEWKSNLDSFAQGGWSYVYPSLKFDNWTVNILILSGYNDGTPIYTDYPCNDFSNYLFSDGTGGMHSLGLGAQVAPNPPSALAAPANETPAAINKPDRLPGATPSFIVIPPLLA